MLFLSLLYNSTVPKINNISKSPTYNTGKNISCEFKFKKGVVSVCIKRRKVLKITVLTMNDEVIYLGEL